tara:strand:+ start:1555 stop:2187 length:633 start_codon:yes stop_codon:yes gene_type:complete
MPTQQEIEKFALKADRPIPGQSLTNNPDAPAPYESAPEITTKEEGANYFIEMFLEEKTNAATMNALAEGVPVMDIVQGVLTHAFEEGVINPDLMLVLAEPVAYLLLGLSERAGIRATIVDDPDDAYDPDDLDNWEYDDVGTASQDDDDDDDAAEDVGTMSQKETTKGSSRANPFREKLQSIKNPKNDEDLKLDEVIKNAPSLMSKPSKKS